ncbi:MAG: class I adenylate-forming enzyme family protein [Acidimicrobiales bacterium]
MSEALNLAGYFESQSESGSEPASDPQSDFRSDRPALVVGDRVTSYRELSQRVACWRGGLVAAGVRQGDRVAILAGNGEEFVLAHLAAIGVGAISVPLNPQSPPAELARELAVVDPFVAVTDAGAAKALAAALAMTVNLEVPSVPLAELDDAQPHAIVDVAPGDTAVLLFTSGTAGMSKPAILTHRNLVAGLEAVLSLPVDLVATPRVFIGVIPLFHVFGLNTILHLCLLTGGTLVLSDFESPEATIELIASHQVSVVAGPPTLWRWLCRAPGATPEQFSSVALAVSGAAKLDPQLKIEVDDRLGVDLTEGYGLTETSAVVAASIATEAPLGSVGRLLPGVEARIVDLAGSDCLVGDPGELLVRGDMVFPGYWGVSSGNASPIDADGWLHTGDIAVVDEAGFLAIVDRRKDLIIVSGFNVFPAEVESILMAHPAVSQAGVVGEPSESTGEAVVAFVVPVEGAAPDDAELREHCQKELARYKIPSRIVIAADLPIGPTGKLRRNRLG